MICDCVHIFPSHNSTVNEGTMTKDAIDQIFDRARHGDVFAQTLMGQILCEGKYVQQDRQNGIGWLRNAAQCNCL